MRVDKVVHVYEPPHEQTLEEIAERSRLPRGADPEWTAVRLHVYSCRHAGSLVDRTSGG